jgi:hypothetical protein
MGLAGGVRVVAFTVDGRELLVGGGKAVRTWDPATARPLRTLASFNAAVLAADMSPNGTTLALGGADGLIRLYDVATATERSHLEGHRGPVICVAYGPGGRTLASVSAGVSMATRPTSRGDQDRATAPPPPPADPEKLWADLAGGPRAALTAQRTLGADPEMAVTLLRERLQPVSEPRDPASPEVLRDLRAVDLLARIGTPAARELLEALARGTPAATVTDAATAALGRM